MWETHMTDDVKISTPSCEAVALELMKIVAATEDKFIPGGYGGETTANRKYILDTYGECLRAVRIMPAKSST
jgi:hypothetical protein